MASPLEEIVVETPACQPNPFSELPPNTPPPPQTKILETLLSFILQLSFSGVTGPPTPPDAHGLACKFYIFVKFVIYASNLVLVMYLAALSYGVIKPISNFIKYLMCVVVATSFATCAFSTVLNMVA